MTESVAPRSAPAALVTGASSGIGEQFARLLAARGHDLVLVARDEKALRELSAELGRNFGANCEVLAEDLSDPAGVAVVAARISDGEALDIVINNAGFGWHGPFAEQPTEVVADMINLNVLALSQLARTALARLIARRAGQLLNVSSVAGFVPGPTAATYHASKAFVTSLTEALHEEARPFGVHVTALCPGVTPSGFQARAGAEHERLPRFATTSASRVASEGLRALERNQAICIPGGFYKAVVAAAHFGGRTTVRRVAARVIRTV
jgi:hypothetical protein